MIDFTAKDIIANFQDIVETIIEIDPKIKIIFSSVIQRFDNDKLQPKVVGLNKDLQALCKKLNLGFLDNFNIVNNHIGQRGLHLNRSGKARLALNLKEKNEWSLMLKPTPRLLTDQHKTVPGYLTKGKGY